MTITLTYSELGQFDACRRLWYWSYYRKLKRKDEPLTGPLPFGSRIHKALENYGKGKVAAPVDAWNPLMSTDYELAKELGWATDDLDAESKLGHAMLSGFPEWASTSGLWSDYEVVAVEEPLADSLELFLPGEVEPVTVTMQGKPDQLVRRRLDGTHFVLDWKTTHALADSVLTVMQKSPQFRMYTLLARRKHPEIHFGGALAVLIRKVQQTSRAKPPFYHTLQVPMSKYDDEEYLHRLVGAASELVRVRRLLDGGAEWREVAYMSPSRINCMSCPFRAPCDLQTTYPAGAADMLAQEYEQHNPLARYTEIHDADQVS